MAYYNTDNNDEQIDAVMRCLFQYQPEAVKQVQYKQIQEIFLNMDVGAHYQLFAFIHERLPMRAKMMFCAEDYQGKHQTVLEVMAHVCKRPVAERCLMTT